MSSWVGAEKEAVMFHKILSEVQVREDSDNHFSPVPLYINAIRWDNVEVRCVEHKHFFEASGAEAKMTKLL